MTHLAKIKNDIANKQAMISGLTEQLKTISSSSDKKSLESEINRAKQEIKNLKERLSKEFK